MLQHAATQFSRESLSRSLIISIRGLIATVVYLSTSVTYAETPAKSAEEETATHTRWSIVLGGAAISAPIYVGSTDREVKLRPVWAAQYGRFRISPSRSAGMLGGVDDRSPDSGAGASVDLLSLDRLTAGVSLRFDPKRKSSDSATLAGLPDIRTTARARVYLGYKLTNKISATVGASHDLLGRGGGGVYNLGIGYGDKITPTLNWSVGTALSFADATYMKTHFGISQETASITGRAAYSPRAGVRDITAGGSLNWNFAPRWFGFMGGGATQLRGDAAASPLTQKKQNWTASAGVAYRFGSR